MSDPQYNQLGQAAHFVRGTCFTARPCPRRYGAIAKMPTFISLFTLALFVGNSAIAAPSPLTARDLLDLKALYESNDSLTIIGERYGNGSAGAEVYWPIKETNFGTCFSHYVFAIGDIVEGRIEWDVPENRDVMTRVWVKQERDDQPCSELLNQPTILLRTPIEEQTFLRLYRSKGDLALEASAFAKTSRLSPAQIENARLVAIGLDRFRDDRTNSYHLEFRISQCSGLSADVVSNDDGTFSVQRASPIVC